MPGQGVSAEGPRLPDGTQLGVAVTPEEADRKVAGTNPAGEIGVTVDPYEHIDPEIRRQSKELVDQLQSKNRQLEGRLMKDARLADGTTVHILSGRFTDDSKKGYGGAGIHDDLGPVLMLSELARYPFAKYSEGETLDELVRFPIKLIGVQDEKSASRWNEILELSVRQAKKEMNLKPVNKELLPRIASYVRNIRVEG